MKKRKKFNQTTAVPLLITLAWFSFLALLIFFYKIA